jgi:RNA polymerase sigma-70 factor (ECF subfamily)
VPDNRQYNDEQALLSRITQGDEKAFNQLFDRYRERLNHYLLRITKSPEITEEIQVDVFLKLWEGKELLLNIYDLEGFLRRVAYYKAMDFFKEISRQERLQQTYMAWSEELTPKSPDELLIESEAQRILLEAINQLSARRKKIYSLSREEGLTHEEIAEALHLSRNTVKNTIMAATLSIADYLKKHYPGKPGQYCFFFYV